MGPGSSFSNSGVIKWKHIMDASQMWLLLQTVTSNQMNRIAWFKYNINHKQTIDARNQSATKSYETRSHKDHLAGVSVGLSTKSIFQTRFYSIHHHSQQHGTIYVHDKIPLALHRCRCWCLPMVFRQRYSSNPGMWTCFSGDYSKINALSGFCPPRHARKERKTGTRTSVCLGT